MIKKLIIFCLITLLILSMFAGCVPAPAPAPVEKPESAAAEDVPEEPVPDEQPELDVDAAYSAVLENFENLNEVSRLSDADTAAISGYMLKWAEDNGLEASQDASGNVIVDRPASEGFEDYPKVILQAHLDYMGFVRDDAQPGGELTSDASGIFTGEGSSFGASDGFGVAEIMYIMTSDAFRCGPLRAVLTAYGDSTFAGASNLDPAVLDSDYLISFDGVQGGTVAYGHTGSKKKVFSKVVTWEENPYDLSYTISINGLSGGDSGLYSDTNNANAIRLLAECMDHVSNAGVTLSVSAISGGENDQTIPDSASAVVTVDAEKKQDFESAIAEYSGILDAAVRENEPSLRFECAENAEVPTQVITQDDSSGLLNLIILSIEGVNTMSATLEGVVESSCSISSVSLGSDALTVEKLERGYSKGRFDQMDNADVTLANMSGFKVDSLYEYPGFSDSPDSSFLLLAVNRMNGVMGEDTPVTMLNTSMEPGFLAEKKPGLEIIIVGNDISGVHSAQESCSTESIKPLMTFMEKLLGSMNSLSSPAAE